MNTSTRIVDTFSWQQSTSHLNSFGWSWGNFPSNIVYMITKNEYFRNGRTFSKNLKNLINKRIHSVVLVVWCGQTRVPKVVSNTSRWDNNINEIMHEKATEIIDTDNINSKMVLTNRWKKKIVKPITCYLTFLNQKSFLHFSENVFFSKFRVIFEKSLISWLKNPIFKDYTKLWKIPCAFRKINKLYSVQKEM